MNLTGFDVQKWMIKIRTQKQKELKFASKEVLRNKVLQERDSEGEVKGKQKIEIQIQKINLKNIKKQKQMHQEGHLHQKIINLCRFINNPDNDNLLNILIQKSRQLGLAISPFFSKQRYIYNFALAAINVIVDYEEGFQLASIFLKDICHGKTYWDILHFLQQLKDEVQQTLTKVDDVFQKVHVSSIVRSHDLNTIYQCHCSITTVNKEHQYKRITNTNKKLQNIINRAQNAERSFELSERDKLLGIPRNKNHKEQMKIVSTSTKFINLDAELIDLCQIQNKNTENQNEMPELSELLLDSGEQFRIFIQQLSQKSSSLSRGIQNIDKMDDQNTEGKKKVRKVWQQKVKNLMNVVNIDSQFQSVSSSLEAEQYEVINVQKQNYIFNQNLLYHLENFNNERDSEKKDFHIDFQFRKDDDVLLLMDQPDKSNNYSNQDKEEKTLMEKTQMNLEKYNAGYFSQKIDIMSRNEEKILERCQLCMQLYHPYCQNSQIFICNTCFLKQNSSNFRVIKNLFTGYVQPNSYLTIITFLSPDVSTAKVQYSSSYIIEMRLQVIRNQRLPQQNLKQNQRININIERKGQDQNKKKKQKKFGKFMFYLNYQPIPVKNLSYGSQIISIKFPLKFLEEKNILIIEKLQSKSSQGKKKLEGVLQNSHLLLVGIYKVVPKSKRKQLIKNSIVQIPMNSMKLFYRSLFEQKKESSFKISTLSYLTNKPMMFPIRSFQCKHPECFDYSEIDSLIYPKKRTLIRKTKNILNKPDGKNIENKNAEENRMKKEKIMRKTSQNKMKKICPKCNVIIEGFYIDSLIKQSIQENMVKDKKEQCFFIQFLDKKLPENNIQVLSLSDNPRVEAEMIDQKLHSDQIIKPAIPFESSSSEEEDSEYEKAKTKSRLTKSKKICKKPKNIGIESQRLKKLMKKQNEVIDQIFQIDQSSLIQIQGDSDDQEQSSCELFILSKQKLEKSKNQMQLEYYGDILRDDWENKKYEVLICEDSF